TSESLTPQVFILSLSPGPIETHGAVLLQSRVHCKDTVVRHRYLPDLGPSQLFPAGAVAGNVDGAGEVIASPPESQFPALAPSSYKKYPHGLRSAHYLRYQRPDGVPVFRILPATHATLPQLQ